MIQNQLHFVVVMLVLGLIGVPSLASADDATEIEYDDFFESIEFKSPSDVKSVVEYLSVELEKKKWTKAATEFDLATFARLKFTLQKSSLEIDVRAEDTGSEISIRTNEMQWDAMKAEIAKAEKDAEEDAAGAPSKQKTAEMPAVLPKRKDKPTQGINELPKLPSEGIVVMDGTTITLPIVIAYEVFENDQWSTKIVATQKVIKQDTLLARLKMSGTDKDEDDRTLTFPEPYLLVELDEDDRPWRLGLLAAGTPGGGTGNELTGTALVEAGRARGTVRMNDTHDGSKAEYGPILFRDNKLKNEHPEYLLGTIQKPLRHGAWSAVNFALPDVRDLAFRDIEEVCRNYDIDGIELDFFRHPVFFKSTSRGDPRRRHAALAIEACHRRQVPACELERESHRDCRDDGLVRKPCRSGFREVWREPPGTDVGWRFAKEGAMDRSGAPGAARKMSSCGFRRCFFRAKSKSY